MGLTYLADWTNGGTLIRLTQSWILGVITYLILIGAAISRTEPFELEAFARDNDESPLGFVALIAIVSILSLFLIIFLLAGLEAPVEKMNRTRYLYAALTFLGSWLLMGITYALHYAHIFYKREDGKECLQFPEQTSNPNYWDFIYFSFTILAALQTPDVNILTTKMRRIVVTQTILSFLFNAIVVGIGINTISQFIGK